MDPDPGNCVTPSRADDSARGGPERAGALDARPTREAVRSPGCLLHRSQFPAYSGMFPCFL